MLKKCGKKIASAQKNINFLDAEIIQLSLNCKKNTKFHGSEKTCILGSYKKKISKFSMRVIIVKIENFSSLEIDIYYLRSHLK